MSWIDFSGDGYPDLHLSNLDFNDPGAENHLYQNNGNGTYTRVLDRTIVQDGASLVSTWADVNGDGLLDAYVCCPAKKNYLYFQQEDGSFVKGDEGILGTNIETTQEVIWVDFNVDGLVDLFVVNHNPHANPEVKGCQLYRHTGEGFQLESNPDIGLTEDDPGGGCWFDYDLDGDPDVIWSRNANNAVFFENQGDGTFVQVLDPAIAGPPNRYYFNPADYDNDGDLDLFSASYPGPPQLLENIEGREFKVVEDAVMAADTGFWSGGYWGDYNNDGWLDLFISAHQMYTPHVNRLYTNNGDGTFSKNETELIGTEVEPSSSAAWADHDLDGDLDLFVANVNNQQNALYNNRGNNNGWFQVKLVGDGLNQSALGAKVRCKAIISGVAVWQLREIAASDGYMAQSPFTAHFGLGDAERVDSLVIEWPDGSTKTLINLEKCQRIEVYKQVQTSISLDQHTKDHVPFTIYPNPCGDYLHVDISRPVDQVSAEIIDLSGQMIKSIAPASQRTLINVSDLKPGYYLLRLNFYKPMTPMIIPTKGIPLLIE